MKIKVIVREIKDYNNQINVDSRCYADEIPIMDGDHHLGQISSNLGWAKIDIPNNNIKRIQALFPDEKEFEFYYEFVAYQEPVDKNNILGHIEDLVSDFLYYDRKECESLPMGEIEKLVESEKITVDEMVEHFRTSLIKGLSK